MNFQDIDASASPEVQTNENFETIDYTSVYGKRQPATTGLVWAYYGGRWGGFAITAGTLTLTNTGDNYVVVLRSSGAISTTVAATNWNNTGLYARVYKLTCAGGVVTATEDHRAGPYGVQGGVDAIHIDNETPAGTISGTDGTDGNAAFTLAYAPNPAGSLMLFKTDVGTGVLMIAGVHYNLATLTITYTAGNLPATGQTHRAWYRK